MTQRISGTAIRGYQKCSLFAFYLHAMRFNTIFFRIPCGYQYESFSPLNKRNRRSTTADARALNNKQPQRKSQRAQPTTQQHTCRSRKKTKHKSTRGGGDWKRARLNPSHEKRDIVQNKIHTAPRQFSVPTFSHQLQKPVFVFRFQFSFKSPSLFRIYSF